MAKTIDQKVVELGFDNKQFKRGVNDSLDSISQLEKGLKLDGATRGLQDVSKTANGMNFNGLSNSISDIQYRFSALGIASMAVITRITNGILDMGKNLVNAIAIDPIKTGLEEYETQINAIQTILANTASKGTTMDDVTGALRELNTYADKTIYNFTEMTRNIGTFTAAGVELDTSVSAIKGIANLAAVSGSTSQQAATAMYQLSQALSSGTVKLMDWNSVVNAGMGGQVFQDALKETARVHGVAIDDMIAEQGSFRETLSEGWLTSEVLLETLAKFTGDLNKEQLLAQGYTAEQAEEIMKLGVMANDAATKVKTFTQLMDTLKEALQSGWTQTWEILIGDFEEAKALFTEISDRLGALIGDSAEGRNNMLSVWKDLGGRDIIIEALFNAFDALTSIMATVKEAMAEIFPPMTAGQLLILTQKVGELVERFKMAVTNSKPLKTILTAVFSIIDIGRMLVVSFVKNFKKFVEGFSEVKGPLGDVVMQIAEFFINLRNAIKDGKAFDKFFSKFFEILAVVIRAVATAVGAVFLGLSKLKDIDLAPIGKWFEDTLVDLKEGTKLGEWFSKAIENISKWIEEAKPKVKEFKDSIVEVFDKFKRGVKNIFGDLEIGNPFENFDFDTFMDRFKVIAGTGLGIGAGGAFIGILKAIKNFIGGAGEAIENVTGILESVQDTFTAYQNNLKADTLQKIAIAIAILVGAIFLLTLVDPDRLGKATLAIAALFAGLVTTLEVFEKMAGGMKKMGGIVIALVGIASAIFILTLALAVISKLDPASMLTGVTAIGGMLAEIMLFTKSTGGAKKMIGLSVGMMFMAQAIVVLTGALFILSKIPVDEVKNGLLLLGGSLLIIGVAMRIMPTNMPAIGFGLGMVATSLIILATALKIFSSNKPEELKTGIIGLASSLLIVGLALNLMNGTLAGSAALLVASIAITVLAGAMKVLGSMPLKAVGVAVLAMAGAFTVIGVAGYLLAPIVPVLFLLGGAILLLGLAMLAAGTGITAFSVGLTTLVAIGAAGGAALSAIILALAATIPLVAKSIGLGLVALFATLAESAPQLLVSLLTLIQTGLTALAISIPRIVAIVMEFVTTLLTTIAERLPELIQAGVDLILALLDGLAQNIGDVVQAATDIVVAFLEAIGESLPQIVDAGFEMLISVIDGISASVGTQTPRLISSVSGLGKSIITGIVSGVWQNVQKLYDTMKTIAANALAKFKGILGIQSPSTEFEDAAKDSILGYTIGLDDFGEKAVKSVQKLGENVVSKLRSTTSKLADTINSDVDLNPVITPVMDLDNVVSGANQVNSMLGDVAIPLNAAASISALNLNASEVSATGVDQEPSQNITFNQNNYSPKALSRYDIYRDTQKQLRFAAKGVLAK